VTPRDVAVFVGRRLAIVGLCFAILYLHAFVAWLDKDKDFDTIHVPVSSGFFEHNRKDIL
jgi:hypothetical protein